MKKFILIFIQILRRFISNPERTLNVIYARLLGVRVGENCRLFSTMFSSESYLISIGNNVTITAGVRFLTHDGGVWVLRNLYKQFSEINVLGRIIIDDNVFVGVNTILLPGIRIGANSIIAAGSVVTKSFGENSIIAGNPARYICSLDDYLNKNKEYFVNTLKLSKQSQHEYLKSEEFLKYERRR